MKGDMKMKRILLAAMATVSLSGCFWGCGEHYSDGVRTGTVPKISKRGYFAPSYEGTMHLGSGASSVSATVWDFSVTNENVAQQIVAASQPKSDGTLPTVTLVYSQWWMHPWTVDTDYKIVEVRGLPPITGLPPSPQPGQ